MTEPEARKHPMFPFFEEFVRDTDACRMDYFEQWSALFAAYVAGASRGIHEKTMGRLS